MLKSWPKVIGVVMLMMMKDSRCHALLLHLKLSSPHYTLVLLKKLLLCIEVPSFTSCTSFLSLTSFFLFWSILYCCTLLRSKLSSPCHTPFVTNISLHKSCLTFLFVWFLEKISFFGWVFCCYRLLFSKLSSSHYSSSPLFYVLDKLSPFF